MIELSDLSAPSAPCQPPGFAGVTGCRWPPRRTAVQSDDQLDLGHEASVVEWLRRGAALHQEGGPQ
jgi:hypothetical protein